MRLRLGFGLPGGGSGPLGPAVRLTSSEASEDDEVGDAVGTLSVVRGSGVYVFSVTADPDSKFQIGASGFDDELQLSATVDFETATSHQVTIEADNSVDPVVTRTFTITVLDVDEVAPTVQSFSPLDNATGVATDADLVVTFSEPVVLGATGTITLKLTSDDSTIDSWDVSADEGTGAGQLEVSGAVLTLHLTSAIAEVAEHYVIWDEGVVEDAAGNAVAALSVTTTWSFTTADETAPTISSLSPADNATDVAIDATLVATFSENVVLGAGTVYLKRTSDDATIDSWDVEIDAGSSAGQCEITNDDELTLHLTTDIENEVEHYVVWDAGVVEDASGNGVAALSTTTTWSFTTVSDVTLDGQMAALFDDGASGFYNGGLYDISDLTSMFVERTSPSTNPAADDVVGYILDKRQMGGKTAAQYMTDEEISDPTLVPGNHLVMPSDAARPQLKFADPLYYLDFDGVNDCGVCASFALTNRFYLGMAIDLDGTTGTIVIEHSANAATNNGFFITPTTNAAWLVRRSASHFDFGNSGWIGASLTDIELQYYDGDVDLLKDGSVVTPGSITGTQAAESETTAALNVFARNGGSVATPGNLYALIIIERELTTDQRATARAWRDARSGLTT